MAKDKVPHPAKFSDVLLPVLAKYAYGHVIDVMGGTGKAGLLKKYNSNILKVTINELEKEWADQASANGVDVVVCKDARYFVEQCDCIVTSPPYGNRMADNFKAGKPSSMRKMYVGDLGRQVSEGSVCCRPFGNGYEEDMTEIYNAVLHNITFTRFILNVSNFIRQFKEVDVIGWYKRYFKNRGFRLIAEENVITRRQKGVGANTHLRVPTEAVLVWERGENSEVVKTKTEVKEKNTMTELIKALTDMAKAITAHYERAGQSLPPATGTDEAMAAAAKVRKARAPKTVEVPATATVETKQDDGLGLDDTAPVKKELTEKESTARMEEVTKQFVSLCKNDKPEDGKTRAMRLMQGVFKVGKLGDLTHAERIKWIAEMEKGIAEHK